MNKFDKVKKEICDSIMKMNSDEFYNFLDYVGGAEFGDVVIPQIISCNDCPYNEKDIEECEFNCHKYYMEIIGESK